MLSGKYRIASFAFESETLHYLNKNSQQNEFSRCHVIHYVIFTCVFTIITIISSSIHNVMSQRQQFGFNVIGCSM